MKSKLTLALVVLLVVAFTLAGCTGGGDENEGGETGITETVKLGTIGALTGDYSMYGVAVENGAKLAADEINAAGGINGQDVEIISYDSKGDKTEAVNAYRRLVDQDGIVGLIGGTFSGETLAIKEIAVGDGIPVLTPTATSDDVAPGADNLFRACYTDSYQGAAVAQFAVEGLEAKTAAIMYNIEDPYSEGLAEAFRKVFNDEGLEITSYDGYKTQDADYSSILTNVKAANPDVIFLPDYTAAVGKITTQIQDMGIEAIALGADGWDGIEAEYADQVEGYYFSNHYSKTDEAENVQGFISDYEEKYGSTPNALAALAYDSVKIMVAAIESANSTDSSAILEELAATDMDGVTGNIMFDDEGDAKNKAISMIKIENGDHVLIEKVVVE